MANIEALETILSTLQREIYIIIGNGFDIEVGLPTSYPEFLAFINTVDAHFQGKIQFYPDLKSLLNKYIDSRKSVGKLTDLSKWQNIPSNFWYRHIQNAHIQKGWIDFENEIACIIRYFEEELKNSDTVDQHMPFNAQSKFFNYIIKPLSETYDVTHLSYRRLRDILLDELNILISAFDNYLQDFVEEIEVQPTRAIRNLFAKLDDYNHCKVLSFNYTSTFDRLIKKYAPEKNIEYCHIHGKVGMNGEPGNIVLGIDEKYNTKGEVSILLAPFKKYYQRVYKNTDSNYRDWLDVIKANDNQRKLYIFGHSIGITDKEILNSFITSNNMVTTIYSHNDKARATQIAYLSEIISIDEMVRRYAGSNKTLYFLEQ